MFTSIVIFYKIKCIKKKIKRLENSIIDFRHDMHLKNNLYYCGRGDVDKFVDESCHHVYMKISAYDRLLARYQRMSVVVGVKNSCGKILKACAAKKIFKLKPSKLIKTN